MTLGNAQALEMDQLENVAGGRKGFGRRPKRTIRIRKKRRIKITGRPRPHFDRESLKEAWHKG